MPLRKSHILDVRLQKLSVCAAVLPRWKHIKEMRLPCAFEDKCARSEQKTDGMSRLQSLIQGVSQTVSRFSQDVTRGRKVDFGSIEFHKFVMEDELAERTVIKRIGPRTKPVVPVSRNLEDHAFADVCNEARALRDASDLADELGYGGSRCWSVVWDSRDGACFYLPHKSGR